MHRLLKAFRMPTAQSTATLVVAFCVVTMSFLSVAVLWQAQVIANQREIIQWLEKMKFGV